jgi:hypothetical protein
MVLDVVSVATLLSVVLGGIGLGFYMAGINRFQPFIESRVLAFSTLLVMGLSFLIPMMTARLFDENVSAELALGVIVLWIVFAASSTVGNTIATRLFGRK